MEIRFWGVRGSIPSPGPNTMKYGGNTLCLEVRFKDPDRLIIVDAGSGIRELGHHMMNNGRNNKPVEAQIFLTHTHWDHIQGFPFFAPIYEKGTKLEVYGPVTHEDESLEEIVGGQWTYRYFPLRREELSAEIKYIGLEEGTFDLGDGIKLTTKYLNHPLLCLGYRFEYRGKVFCTAFDTEPFQNLFCTDPDNPAYDEAMANDGKQVATEENQRLEDFFAKADFLVHDTQYTEKEYTGSKVGWGHSSIEHAIAAAKRTGVKRLALFHHEPMRTDSEMDKLARKYCKAKYSGDTKVFLAREGLVVKI